MTTGIKWSQRLAIATIWSPVAHGEWKHFFEGLLHRWTHLKWRQIWGFTSTTSDWLTHSSRSIFYWLDEKSSTAGIDSVDPRLKTLTACQFRHHSVGMIYILTLNRCIRTYNNNITNNNNRIARIAEDSREHAFLHQRISVIIQRFNSIGFRDTFTDETNPKGWPFQTFNLMFLTLWHCTLEGTTNNNSP